MQAIYVIKKDTEPDFRRTDETAMLIRKHLHGQWQPAERYSDMIISTLLPLNLRELFIMDADKIADYVGGSENKTISPQEYIAKTTHAINSILGLQIFKAARNRIEGIASEFERQATKAIGTHDLKELQKELNDEKNERQKAETAIQDLETEVSWLDNEIKNLKPKLEQEIGRLYTYDSLKERLITHRKEYKRAHSKRERCVTNLVGDLESVSLLASLASAAISETYKSLKPLYLKGSIPLAHLPFVRDLLTKGQCVCGQILSENSLQRQRIEQSIETTSEKAGQADHLYNLYQASESLIGVIRNSTWNDSRTDHAAELANCDDRISELKNEEKDINTKLEGIDDAKVQILRNELTAHEQKFQTTSGNLIFLKNKKQQLDTTIDSLQKTINQRHKQERAATHHMKAKDMATHAIRILKNAYIAIEHKQVQSLSERMNRLFYQMAANVSDADFDDTQQSKANLRMIHKVGLRSAGSRDEDFEIYALNSRGRAMPPIEINGASRRVLALSFVLALCHESNTRAPLIADSLLNFMSGTVRHNTLRVTLEHSRQPILLLTNSDLEASSEIAIVEKHAGATYTLTGQWDAIDAGMGGDVINWTQNKQVSMLCSCNPRQYCNICERIGQVEADGWARRHDTQHEQSSRNRIGQAEADGWARRRSTEGKER